MKNIKRAAAITIAAGGLAVAGAGVASATQADGAAVNSPGVLSGNVVQVPVKAQTNICGNSIQVVGILNPVFGNSCQNN
ncbi:chaplin [Streptomyces piniterrae]|uniref:Chaplin n=1 Tax=Streptomyces piniterrae TaxID=2571125 RepID=A0A4U0NBD3_9ACTN|nr:chaplin [Streptomyces piniterrae]TJZ51219.1 chaplin [Streptomyces piniterrae]